MTLVLEDGTGITAANAYTSAAAFKLYHKDRGNDFTDGSSDIEKAIIKATDFIDRKFGGRFKGVKEFATENDLEFPRLKLYNRAGVLVTGVPTKLAWATAEYAFRALTEELFLTPTIDETGLRRIGFREKTGPIEEDVKYAESTTRELNRPYPVADRLLVEYLKTANTLTR